MALVNHASAGLRRFTGRLFDAVRHGGQAPAKRTVYRCAGCGEEIAFDALAASCRCADECYGAAGTQAVDPAAGHH